MSPQLAALRHVAARSCERLADLGARSVTGPAAAPQGLAGLEDERFDLFAANAEHRADLGMRVVTELEEDQRRTLVWRQPSDVVEQLVELLRALELICRLVVARAAFDQSLAVERSRA
jgi:hypothetical protein